MPTFASQKPWCGRGQGNARTSFCLFGLPFMFSYQRLGVFVVLIIIKSNHVLRSVVFAEKEKQADKVLL